MDVDLSAHALYTTKQVAALLDLSPSHVTYVARKHTLGTKFGTMRLYTWADVQAIDSRKKTHGPATQKRKD